MAAEAPSNLAVKGQELWDQIAGFYQLRPDELRLLEDACREVDLVERLEVELRDAPLMVKGSMGQLVASPLVSELRQHRMAAKALLGALKLPDEAPDAGSTSSSARAAARARWSRGA